MTQLFARPKTLATLSVLVFGAFGSALLAGCGNTLNGAKQDAATDSQKAANATDQAAAQTGAAVRKAGAATDQAVAQTGADVRKAGAAVSDATDQAAAKTGAAVRRAGAAVANAPKDIAEAAIITPEVKTSVIRDPVLNDLKNLVNVSTANGIVTLSGHVQTVSMKQRATEDAQAVLDKHHDTYTITNTLAVGPVGL